MGAHLKKSTSSKKGLYCRDVFNRSFYLTLLQTPALITNQEEMNKVHNTLKVDLKFWMGITKVNRKSNNDY